VAGQSQTTSNDFPTSTTVPLSEATTGSAGSGGALTIPLTLPSDATGPGVYLVNADLVDTTSGSTIGSTCLTYSVGAAGDALDFSTLSPGLDYGGPAPVRGVQLAAAFGTGLDREGLTWSTLLPNCNSSDVTMATCGPSALTFSAYDPVTEEAAAKAKALGVAFVLLVIGQAVMRWMIRGTLNSVR